MSKPEVTFDSSVMVKKDEQYNIRGISNSKEYTLAKEIINDLSRILIVFTLAHFINHFLDSTNHPWLNHDFLQTTIAFAAGTLIFHLFARGIFTVEDEVQSIIKTLFMKN